MSDEDNVVRFQPPQVPAANDIATRSEQELCDVVQNLVDYCERLDEGMQHIASLLVALDSRLRRLELAYNKAEREKVTKTAIYNPQGQRVS